MIRETEIGVVVKEVEAGREKIREVGVVKRKILKVKVVTGKAMRTEMRAQEVFSVIEA